MKQPIQEYTYEVYFTSNIGDGSKEIKTTNAGAAFRECLARLNKSRKYKNENPMLIKAVRQGRTRGSGYTEYTPPPKYRAEGIFSL